MKKKPAKSKPKTSARQKAKGCRRPSSGYAWMRLVEDAQRKADEALKMVKMAYEEPPHVMLSVKDGEVMLTTFGFSPTAERYDAKFVAVSFNEVVADIDQEVRRCFCFDETDVYIKAFIRAAKLLRKAKRAHLDG